MKNSYFLCVLGCMAFHVNAQQSFTINENGGPSVSCDAISVDTQNNIYEFTGNVDFKTADINIEKAQKVILNTKTRKVSATGVYKVTMTKKGTSVINVDAECKKASLEYKLGRKRLLVNKNCQ